MSIGSSLVQTVLRDHGYSIVSQIGKGAQGVCYLVNSHKYNLNFICKCIHLSFGMEERTIKQFETEVYSLTHIIHKNIVQIFDYFTEGQFLFMVIEYCPQGSLMDAIKKYRQPQASINIFPYDYIRRIMIDVLSALEYCHNQKHISHHDIKPANILLDSIGRAKLCDFGISFFVQKQTENEEERERMDSTGCHPAVWEAENANARQNTSGSLLFMSPQLLQTSLFPDCKYDMFAADMWAFGVSTYLLLTGQLPFFGRTKREMLERQLASTNGEEYRLDLLGENIFAKLPLDVPHDIRHVLEKCLELDETKRGTAIDMLNYLKMNSNASLGITRSCMNYKPFKPCSSLPSSMAAGPRLVKPCRAKNPSSLSRVSTQALLLSKNEKPEIRATISSSKLIIV